MLWDLEACCCQGAWGNPRTVKRVCLRGVQGSKTNTRKPRAGHPLVLAAITPSEHPSLRSSFPGRFSQHFPPWWSCLRKQRHCGQLFLPGYGIFLAVHPISTSQSRTAEQLGSASNSITPAMAKSFLNSYSKGS